MSSSGPSDSPPRPTERLEIPTLPSPSSRFVLPPPPSDLLNRLQAFLPQIRDANAQLETRMAIGEEEEEEEAVVMEELSSDSEEEETSDEDGSSDEDSDDGEELGDVEGTGRLQGVQGGENLEQEEEAGSFARLMDISACPKVVKKNLVVEETDSLGYVLERRTTRKSKVLCCDGNRFAEGRFIAPGTPPGAILSADLFDHRTSALVAARPAARRAA
ncbi:hypothetical protein JCM10295v2_002816 [Rhodotorula toruloides]